jgi:hypothetical protein
LEKYSIEIVMRDGMGQTSDDYHATVTRLSDKTQLIFISEWRWLLKWKVRRKALDRAFARYEKHQMRLEEIDRLHR